MNLRNVCKRITSTIVKCNSISNATRLDTVTVGYKRGQYAFILLTQLDAFNFYTIFIQKVEIKQLLF